MSGIITPENPTGANIPRQAVINRIGTNIMAMFNNEAITHNEARIILTACLTGVINSTGQPLPVRMVMRQEFANALIMSGLMELMPNNVMMAPPESMPKVMS